MGSKGMLVHSVREKVVGHEVKICFRGGGGLPMDRCREEYMQPLLLVLYPKLKKPAVNVVLEKDGQLSKGLT